MRKHNYSITKPNPSKEDAIKLLNRLVSDEAFLLDQKNQAVIWAKDRAGLTFTEIAKIFNYANKSAAFKFYNRAKGGKS